MVDVLTTILRETLGVLFNPGHFLSVMPLVMAFAIAFMIVTVRRRRKIGARRLSFRRIMLMLFPRRIFLHKSARLDYAVFAINQIVLIFLTVSAFFSPALISTIIVEFGRSVGLEPEGTESSLAIRVTYSIFLVLLWDFSATYAHYLKHRVPILWELHKVHHSAEVMTPVTALRRHPFEALFSSVVIATVMGIGIGIWVLVLGQNVMPYYAFGTLVGIWVWRLAGYNLRHSHIWISYGDFWNRIFISPAQHQVHHSKLPAHYDKNFGHIFSIWDKLFGTLYLPKFEERMKFGISDAEAREYRSLFGLYVTPILKIGRRGICGLMMFSGDDSAPFCMLFASLTFILGFLPIVIVGTVFAVRFSGPRGAVIVLSAASFVFYGWYHPPYVVLLVYTIALNVFLARGIHRCVRKSLTALAITLNLALLAWFKYAGFLENTVTTITGAEITLPPILLPLGISFFTFQQIAYLVDIYQGKAKPGAILDYVFLISFFPQLIAGPIVHHSQLIPQLGRSRFASFQHDDVAAGTMLFVIGLAKKALIADSLAPGADALFAAEELGIDITMAEAWFGVLCYTFQIYFDFSGYSDMALGLGLIFGLQLPVNFRSPYKSSNIIDFWRRWNITLSTFLRDYLYVPLGGNRKGPILRYTNLWIVMLLGGLWHGAGWQFIIWGGLHGFYLTINHLWRMSTECTSIRLPTACSTVLTFGCVVIAWVFFRASDVEQAFSIVGAMADFHSPNTLVIEIFDKIDTTLLVLILAASLTWFAPNALEIKERICDMRCSAESRSSIYRLSGVLAAAALFTIYVNGNHAFIYFQF